MLLPPIDSALANHPHAFTRPARTCVDKRPGRVLQANLDAKRAEINEPREAFRQKYLEAERKRLEAIAAQEEAMRAEMEKNSPTPKGKKSAKDKKSASGKKKK